MTDPSTLATEQAVERTRLTNAEQAELFRTLRDPDADARERAAAREALIVRNGGLVRLAVRRVSAPSYCDFRDLIGWGEVGLIRAVDHYDPACGVLFSTYAYTTIRRVVRKFVLDCEHRIRIPAYLYDPSRPHANPVRRAENRRYADAAAGCCIAGEAPLPDRAATEPADEPTAAERAADEVKRLLSRIPRREADLLRRRYGIGCEPESGPEAAAREGVSRSRINHLCRRATEMVRAQKRRLKTPA